MPTRQKILILIILIFSITLSAEIIDNIVAKIGREVVLKSELETRIQQLKAAGAYNQKVSKFKVLNNMVESRLIIQKAKEEGYETDDIKIKQMANEQIRQVASQFPDEKKFKAELEKSGLNLPELKEYYIQQLTEQNLKEQIIQNEIKSKINITESEVYDYYKDNEEEIPKRPQMVKLGMILRTIKPSDDTIEKILIEINKIRDKLIQGENFSELAREYSDGPTGKNGGNLGWFGKGMMVKPFEKVAFSLTIGEISEVVKTQFGYHIIIINDKKDNEVNASHILKTIEPTEEDIESTLILMDNVLQQLNNGADFSEMAKTYSVDDSTAVNGGILGEFSPDKFPELFQEELKLIEVGEFTSVIRQDNNLYILGKLEKVEERPYKYEEIFSKLKDIVKSNKEMEIYNNWIKSLMQENYVEILIEE